ncbi:ABC transporter permease [Paraburkholderia sp. ZP32-5]|uniref:ABC transporter permease n=1 Tax=Paraburkholderia sp. ZP32-5 TaxID=2883245 RepID=UPI001F1863FA|nr:ABC transporter permease [Paraburkholderia sp. ZP32-5]
MKTLSRRFGARFWLPPLITLVSVIGVWQLAVAVLHIPQYILPLPSDVFTALVSGFADGTLWPHIGYTLLETAAGYAIGSLLAVLFGALLAESATFERYVYPLLTGIQAVPKVALAPLILVWFGFGFASKLVLVVLICFFPLFINMLVGIRRVDPELIDACRAFHASRSFIFFHVKLPYVAGDIFAGLQIGVSLALIGAVVGEFVSSQQGLGYLVQSSATNMSIPTMYAGVLLLAVIGIGGSQLVRTVHRHVVFWEASTDGNADA